MESNEPARHLERRELSLNSTMNREDSEATSDRTKWRTRWTHADTPARTGGPARSAAELSKLVVVAVLRKVLMAVVLDTLAVPLLLCIEIG